MLMYMDEKGLVEYLKEVSKVYKARKEMIDYKNELRKISSLDEWLVLLNKYPSIGNPIKGLTKERQAIFKNLILDAKNDKYFLVYNGEAGIRMVENTKENASEFKNNKKLSIKNEIK